MTQNPQDQPAEGGQQPYSGQPYAGQPPPPPPAPAYGQPAYGQMGPAGQSPVSPSDARMWAMFASLGGLLLLVVAPLVIYLIYKDRDPFIRRHSAQALNFQIIVAIVEVVSVPLVFIGIGVLTGFAAGIALLVFSILAAVAANKGEEYTYPYIPQMVT